MNTLEKRRKAYHDFQRENGVLMSRFPEDELRQALFTAYNWMGEEARTSEYKHYVKARKLVESVIENQGIGGSEDEVNE